MSIARVQLPDGRIATVEIPDGLSIQQAQTLLNQQFSAQQPEPPVGSAGFSLKDTARAAQQGLYGGLQSLTDLFGAGNVVSKDLAELQQEAAGKMSEERKAEIARRELLKKKAEGNTWEEIKATVGGFAEAPLQTSIGALASSAPIIASAFIPGGQPAAVAGLTGRAALGARALAAAKSPAAGIGALMGVGGQKGQDYEAVKAALLEKNYSEAEAERLAQQVSGYSLENAPRQLAAGLMGGLEGVTGIEGLLGRAGRLGKTLPKVDKSVDLPEPTFGGALGRNILGEAAPEALQAGTGQVGTNIALNQAGIPTDLMQGVAAQVIHDALVGGTLGAATSPLKLREMRQEYVNDEIARKREEDEKIAQGRRDAAAQRQKTKEQIVGDQPLLLAGPSQELEPVKEVAPLQNPIGNLTPDELGPEVSSYLNQYRKTNGLPRLQSYSIEDVKDAMTAVNPEGEKAALDSILAAKTGYTGQQNFTAKDVENAAIEKNVATGTKGFSDFLARTTGVNSLDQMSEPQLYAAFKALTDMPANTTGEQMVLPEGTNASRFTQKQYDSAVKYVGLTFDENNGKPLSTETILSDIKDSTNLATDRDAKALLDTAINNGDLEKSEQVVYRTFKPDTDQMVATYPTRERAAAAAKKQGLNVREATLTQVAPKAPVTPPTAPRAGLPAGYDITERQFKEGEEPEGYQITSEEGGKPFPTVFNKAELQGKINQLTADRSEIADKKLQELIKYEQAINEGKRELEKMEAAGEFDTDAYKQKKARQAAKEDLLGKRLDALDKEITSLLSPLKSKPVGVKPIARKGYTITKDGKEVGTFPSREAAEDSILAGLSDAELEALVSDKKFGGLQTRIINEQNRRSGKAPVDEEGKPVKTKKVSEVLKDLESGPPVEETPELLAKTKPLRDMLNRFGLGDVALKLVKAIENQADGSYAGKVIELALDAKNPIRTLRHESLHALKELGFFTDAQWKSLEKMARDKWIPKYLEGSKAVLQDGTTGTRLQAYKEMGLSEADIIEEAIADAFGDFDASKAPPGLLTALLNKLRGFFESLNNYLAGRGFENSQDIFGAADKGKLKAQPPAGTAQANTWKATPEDTAKAETYFEENGIMPYTSEGQLDVPVEVSGKKFSIKGAYTEAQATERVKKRRDGSEVVVPAKFNDPITGLPMNADGTVTLYYPTTNEIARNIATAKKLTAHSPTANRIYLTNESSANAVAMNPGMIDQPLGGANVMFKVDPTMIELGQVYPDGRRDFFIPIAEGEVFAKKMKMTKLFTVNAPRDKGLHTDRTLSQVTEGVEKAATAWKNANPKERAQMFSDAKDVLREQHNIGTLFGANAKLEKTNIGDYGLLFKGKKVMSTGLGFASAQKINDQSRESTCPKSAICEALCLGETSGQNELYGGEGPYRSGPRLSQFLKTEAFIVNPEAFTTSMIRQIENFRNAAKKLGYYPAIRLNVTSDFPAKMYKPVIEMFPDVQFYDYTKLETKPIAENHHLTYSSTGASQEINGNIIYNKESNWDRVVDKILSAGKNVAMAFTSRNDMPKFVKDERTGQTFEVWNGDEYDARFLDPVRDDGKGWIVGLTNKDRTTAPEEAASRHNGFFLDYDPQRDGDTLVIKNQKNLAAEFQGKPPEPTPPSTFKGIPVKKMSLREAPDTPAFKKWFGDSKIVNKPTVSKVNGKNIVGPATPKLMYHGTARDISTFKPKQANAIFVTADEGFAEQFSDASKEFIRREIWDGFDLDEQNRLVIEALEEARNAKDLTSEQYKNILTQIDPSYGFSYRSIPAKIRDRVIDKVDLEMPTGPNVMPVYVSAQNPFDYSDSAQVDKLYRQLVKSYDFTDDPRIMAQIKRGEWGVIESQIVQDAIKKLGHDAFYVVEDGIKNLGVYDPAQLKSATGNIGTYDAKNPDLRYSLREAPDTPEFKQFFKRSGFINSSGQPAVMYHATDADITEFRSSEDGKLGAGIYMSSVPKYVNQYAPEGNVMPLYASAQNPFILNISNDAVKTLSETRRAYGMGIGQQMEAAVTLLTQGKKRLKDLTGQQVQNLFKRNGYDGIMARDDAGNIIEATVFKPEQVKSATGNVGTYSSKSKDIRYSLRDATDMFEPSAVEEYSTQYSKSKIKMVNMPIDDFLKIAEFGYNKDKEIAANERVQNGVKFKTLPGLTVYTKDGDLQVTGHEGRHRARALQKAGYETMPVLWESDIIWGAQTDPEAWGYEAKWPDRVYAQKGALREYSSIPMPFTREEAGQNYQVPTKKFSVRSLADEIRAMPNGEKMLESVMTKTTVREEKSIARRILDAFSGDSIATLRQQALNRYNQLSVYDKMLADKMGGKQLLADSSAEAAALLSDTASGVAAAAFGVNNVGGAPVYRNGVTVVDNFDGKVKGLMDILMPLAEMKDPLAYRLFQFYAASKRGSRFEADENGTVKEILFNKDDFAYAASLEAQYPAFKQVHADWIAYNDKLVDYMVATGVINQAKAKEFTRYADYIPFYRQLEGQDTVGPKVFQSISGVKAPKKAKGDTEAPLADFMETIVRNTQSIIQAGMKNTAGQKAIDVALQLNLADKLDKQSSAPGTVTIMRDGEYVSYAVGDPLFIDSLKSLNMPDVKLWGIFAGPAGLLRSMVTKDPGFMLANLLRDSMSAYVTSGVKMTPVADTVANFGRAIGGTDPTYQALVKAGILGGYDYAQGVERSGSQLTADLRKRTGNQRFSEKAMDGFGLWSTLEKGTSASDAATRMAVYNKVLEDTGNEAEAIFRALEVMNFNRKGANPMVRLLTAAIPFLNARMQGLDVFYRAGIQPFLDKNPTERAKAVQKAFFVRGMYMTSLSIAYWAMTHDDDDYLAQEQETRDNNWLIPSLGVKIPIPFEVGVLFKVIPERIMGYTMGDDTGKDFAESMGRAAWSTFGFLPVPQTALPLLEAATNYSFYTGRNIVGAGMEGVSPEFQTGPSTSKVATFLGDQLGASPMKIDHIIKGYTGTIGTYVVDLMDSIGDLNSESPKAAKRFEQMPVLKRFALDPEAKGTVTAYYKLKDAVDETVRTINLLERTGKYDELAVFAEENAKMYGTRHYISNMEKQMKVMREAALQINNSSMTATEKRDALSAINQAQINMTRHIQGVKKMLAE